MQRSPALQEMVCTLCRDFPVPQWCVTLQSRMSQHQSWWFLRPDSLPPPHMEGKSFAASARSSRYALCRSYDLCPFIKIRLRAMLRVCGLGLAVKLAWSLQHTVEPNPCNQQRVIYSVPPAPRLNRCQRVANVPGGRH